MDPTTLAILAGIAKAAPALVGELLGLLHTEGHVTVEEVSKFVLGWKDPASFFPKRAQS